MKSLLRTVWIFAVALLASSALADDHITFQSRMQPGTWKIYTVQVDPWESHLEAKIPARAADLHLYVRYGQAPTLTQFDYRDNSGAKSKSIVVDEQSPTKIATGTYYIGVYAPVKAVMFGEIHVTRTTSDFPGMGATVYPGGTSFRVWAPFADSVSIAGQFNNWNSSDAQLVSEGNGIFSIDHRHAVTGQQYRFVIRNGGQTLWKNDPRSKWLTNSAGNSRIYNPDFNWTSDGYTTPAWNEMVVYEMHVGTFNDQPGGNPGTFASAIQRLDYLQDLGINTILLMPFNEFPGDYSWGYNPSYPFSVETAYGGPTGLKQFVDAAHNRGIAVMMDVVHNHWGPNDLDLWRFDGWSQGDFGGIYFYQDNRSFTPWGDTRPDYGRNEVRQYIRDSVLFFLNDYRLDGLRWDSVYYTRKSDWGDNPEGWSLMQWINDEVDATQPWKLIVGEDLNIEPYVTRPTALGGAGFDSQWEGNFVHPLRPLMTGPDDNGRDMNSLAFAITHNYNGSALQRMIYTESHDEVANGRSRVAQEIDPGNPGSYWARKRSTLGAVVALTSPGIPMIFQGQEILEDEYFRDDDPVDWNKLTLYPGVNMLYRDLIRLRRNWNNESRGLTGPNLNLYHVNNSAKVVAYHRWMNGGPNDDVIVILNWRNQTFNNYEVGLPSGGNWRVVFNSDWVGYGADFANTFSPDITASANPMHGLSHRGAFNLGPYSALIVVKD